MRYTSHAVQSLHLMLSCSIATSGLALGWMSGRRTMYQQGKSCLSELLQQSILERQQTNEAALP